MRSNFMQVTGSDSANSERTELDTVLAALARNPRLAKLLKFLAERALAGKAEEITEYAIATEVFGRSKISFDGSTDSIARVETYRLRKRLKEYYDTEGLDHSIVISLPFRSYIPEFNRRAASAQTAIVGSVAAVSAQEDSPPTNAELAEGPPEVIPEEPADAGQHDNRRRILLYGAVAVLLAVSIIAGFKFVTRTMPGGHADTPASGPANDKGNVAGGDVAHVPLRLLAGYEGSPKIDSAGAYWEPDRYFLGSSGFARPSTPVARNIDRMLFDHWRTGGDFSYNIPLASGTYELHLFFIASPPDDKSQYFNVTANGKPLLTSFNISADVLGANIADEKVFKDISPDKDGYLHLKFSPDRTTPVLNAIELLPGLPHRMLPLRIVTQSAAVTDHDGNLWRPDNYFENGTMSDPPRQVSGTPDPNLYAQERYGHFTYSLPVDARGRYTVILHFAELYWQPDPSNKIGVGTRVFSVYCNGTTLLDGFDIFKEAGSLHAVTKTFSHLRPTPEGKLDLTFDPIANYATVSAIEVIDESE